MQLGIVKSVSMRQADSFCQGCRSHRDRQGEPYLRNKLCDVACYTALYVLVDAYLAVLALLV